MWAVVFAQEVGDAGETAAQGPGGAGGMTGTFLFFGMFILIMWFFLFRPQMKREKERRQMLGSLSKGDRVVTTGGICGTIVGLNDKAVVLRVSEQPAVKMEFVRGAVARVLAPGETEVEQSDEE